MTRVRNTVIVGALLALLGGVVLGPHHHTVGPLSGGAPACAACVVSHSTAVTAPAAALAAPLTVTLTPPRQLANRLVPRQIPLLSCAPSTAPPSIA